MIQKSKDIHYAAQHDISTLIEILYDLLPPCEVTIKDDILYLLFYTNISADSIANLLKINNSYINIVTPLTGNKNHFAIPLDDIRREVDG